MRRLFAALACVGTIATAQAQLQALMPTPFGAVMATGQWLLFNNKRVYYIEVRGQGPTAEEARMNGFRLAVEQALGSVIASETEQQNSRIRRDEVISYAAGFVERYEIVSTMPTGSGYEIVMRVWVQRTNLAERLLVKSRADGQIDGARAAIAIDTAQYSRSQGDRILGTVLKDFPERSFDVRLEATRVELDSRRNTELVIPFAIAWNRVYVQSVTSARKSVSTCGWNGCSMDQWSMDLLADELINSRPQVLVTVTSLTGAVRHRVCYAYDALTQDNSLGYSVPRYFVRRTDLVPDVGTSIRSEIKLPVSSQDLADLSQVDVRVVRASNCPSQVLVYHK
jgi:hypothetical protein